MNRKYISGAFVLALALCVTVATTVWGQGRGPRNNPGQRADAPLQLLKQALNKAGAAALDSGQEEALRSSIMAFRNANRQGTPDPAEKAARDDYSNAIIAGNNDAARTAADKLAGLISARQQTRLEAEAAFGIQALSILHSDQIAALQTSVGKEGMLRILASMIGPGGGFGRGMMRRGPMVSRAPGNQL